jgi:Protein of unknown function (DUF3027)
MSDVQVTDPALAAAVDLAFAALLEITPASTVGDPIGVVDNGAGVFSLHFACRIAGYPGWHWTVSLASVDGAAPTVLEAELLPGEGALLAPDWLPWSDRLAEWTAQQEDSDDEPEDDEADADEDDDSDEDDSDEDDSDEDDDSEDEDSEFLDVDDTDYDAVD